MNRGKGLVGLADRQGGCGAVASHRTQKVIMPANKSFGCAKDWVQQGTRAQCWF